MRPFPLVYGLEPQNVQIQTQGSERERESWIPGMNFIKCLKQSLESWLGSGICLNMFVFNVRTMSIIINVQTYSSYLEALSHFVWLGEWIGSWEGIQIPFKQLKRPVLNRNRSQLWWKWTWFWKGLEMFVALSSVCIRDPFLIHAEDEPGES
jgi:hypothetical protein